MTYSARLWFFPSAERPQGISVLYTRRSPPQIVTVFNQAVKLGPDEVERGWSVSANGGSVTGTWRNSQGTQHHSLVWVSLAKKPIFPQDCLFLLLCGNFFFNILESNSPLHFHIDFLFICDE